MSKFIDLTGKRFYRLTVIERTEDRIQPNGKHKTQWLCKCDCGNSCVVIGSNLIRGNTKSCGCYCVERSKESNTKHGLRYDRLYSVWNDIKNRCYYEKDKKYNVYGGRGIKVCDEWLHDFQAFYDWAMSHGYANDLTIDRIDVNGNYEPSNCRWVTQKVQQNNRRNNHYITYNGKTQTLQQWADETGIKNSTIRMRIKNGWSIEKALNTP